MGPYIRAACSSSTSTSAGANASASASKTAPAYPVTVTSCGVPVTYDKAPQRAVSNDINTTEDMLALNLEPHMVGTFAAVGDGPVQRSGIGYRGYDVQAAAGEGLGEPVPHDGGVLGDHEAEARRHQACPGRLIVMAVGPPAGLSMSRCPSTVWTRSQSPASPPPGASRAPPLPYRRPSSVSGPGHH